MFNGDILVFSFGFLAVFKWLECSCDKIDFEFGDGWNVHGMSMEAFTRYSMETYILFSFGFLAAFKFLA